MENDFAVYSERFLRYLEVNWKSSMARFKTNNQNQIWLETDFFKQESSHNPGPGAPAKPYLESGNKIKKSKLCPVLEEIEVNSPNRTEAACKKILEKSFEISKNLSFSAPENKPKKLSVTESYKILSHCKFSKLEYMKLVKILKVSSVELKSYEWIRQKILKKMKSELAMVAKKESVKIDPSVSLLWSLNKILGFISFNDSTDLSEIKYVIKFGLDGAQSLQEINFQTENDIDNKYFFIIGYVPLLIYKNSNLIWSNENANSVEQFKPLEILFVKKMTIYRMQLIKNIWNFEQKMTMGLSWKYFQQ